MSSRHRSDSSTGATDNVILFNSQTGQVVNRPSYLVESQSKVMDDYVIPNFNARIKAGEVINNPLSYEVDSRVVDPSEVFFLQVYNPDPVAGTFSLTHGNNTAHQLLNVCNYTGYDSNSVSLSFDAPSLAKTKALANVDSTPYEFFEDLMEIRETLRFLRSPLATISNLAQAFRRKHDRAVNYKDAFKRAEALADLWNTYRFAFAPLVRSAMTAAEALADKNVRRPGRRNAHGYAFDKKETSELHEPWTGGVGTQVVYQYRKISAKNRRVHASILYEVSNPIVDVNFKLGLRRKDIPKTLWELVPLSFMYDRIWDIKSLISAYMNLADPNVTILSGSVTDRVEAIHTNSCVGMYSPYGTFTWTIGLPDTVTWNKFTMNRSLWQPGVNDIVPPLTGRRLVKDITSILDLIAIIFSRLPKKFGHLG